MSKELKTQLILQCMTTVGNDLDRRRTLNIAVIGPPGCGKSSFLNTIFASFKNNERACWREIAKMGDYGEHDIQEPARLRIYPKQAYIEDSTNRVLMPTFLDMNGLEDEEIEFNKEILSIFFNGKLRGGEDLNSVRQCYVNNGRDIDKLKQLYDNRSVIVRVDRIIIVCTANGTQPLPESLLRAIRETAKEGSRRTPSMLEKLRRVIKDTQKKGSREIPVYGVLTHADKQRRNDIHYIRRQKVFKEKLGLIDTRFKCIANYSTDADPTGSYISTTFPHLDIPVLELMTQVLYRHPDDTITPDEPMLWKKILAFVFAITGIIILLAICRRGLYHNRAKIYIGICHFVNSRFKIK